MHKVEMGNRKLTFRHITSISKIQQIEKDDYLILVQNEDTVDIWTAKNSTRGVNDLVHYYELWNDRQINEQDLIVMFPKTFYV